MAGVVLPAAVVELLVVLPKEIGTVVTAVRSAYDRVHVVPAGDLVVEHDAGMVVEREIGRASCRERVLACV